MTNLNILKNLIALLEDNKESTKSENNIIPENSSNSINDLFLGEYVIVRTYSAGVVAGILKRKVGNEVELHNARRIWYWKGAASLSQLAQSGTCSPDECKFPEEVDKILLIGVIEILKVSDKAIKSIKGVPVWKN